MRGAIKGDERDRELVPIQVRVVGHVEHLDIAWRAFGPDEGRNQRHRERRSDAIIDQQLYSAGQ